MINLFEQINSPLMLVVEFNILFASLGLIVVRRIIYAALCLGFVLLNIALWYLMLNAEFIAAVQVLIYVGAINVLILFAIMLINSATSDLQNPQQTWWEKISLIFLAILFGNLLLIIWKTAWSSLAPSNHSMINALPYPIKNNIDIIGIQLLQEYFLPFELLSLLLLVSLIGAIYIARK